MLRYYVKKSFNEEPQEVTSEPVGHAWIYGSEVTKEELETLVTQHQLDDAVLHDVRDIQELPRVEYSNGALYIFLRTPYINSRNEIATVPYLTVIKNGDLFTLSAKKYFTPKEVFEFVHFSMRSNRHVFLQLASYVTHSFEKYIHKTGDYIIDTQRRLATHEVNNKDFIKFVSVENDLNEYGTNLTAMRAVLLRLCDNKHALFTEKECDFIEDVVQHIDQLLVAVQSHVQSIDSIRNAYTTISNNTLNVRMKTLTLLTLLVALPNVFYGMYGMNVQLPFMEESWAYFAVVGFSIVVVILAYLFVRRKRF